MIKTLRTLGLAWVLVALAGTLRPPEISAQDALARPPASTLRQPDSRTTSPDPDGFIQRWLILEPIRRNGSLADGPVQAAVKADYFQNQFTVLPRDGDRVTVNDTTLVWHAVDTSLYNVNLYHFAYALNKPTSNVLFWAVTVVHAPQEIPSVRLAIGSNAASVWWLNGEEVIGIYNDRQTTIDDGVSKRLTLKQGPNIIRAAIINAGGATDFAARFIDEEGNPVTGISIGLEAR